MFSSIGLRLLVAMMLLVLGCGLLVGTTGYLESAKIVERQFHQELENTSALISSNIQNKLTLAAQKVEVLAKKRFIQDTSKMHYTQSILDDFVRFVDLYYSTYLFSLEGPVKAMAYADGRDTKRYEHLDYTKYDESFTTYTTEVLKTGEGRYTSSFTPGKDKLLITYLTPVINKEGDTTGLLSCAVQINDPKLKAFLEQLKPSFDGFLALLDSKGKILASSGNLSEEVKDFDLIQLKSGLSKEMQLGDKNYRFELRELSFAKVHVVTAIEASVVSSTIEQLLLQIILITSLTLLLTLALAFSITRKLTKPITSLVQGMQRVREGIYSKPIDEKSSGEMAQAIDAYNEMTEQLQKKRLIEKVWIENWEARS